MRQAEARRDAQRGQAGFTLIELLVVMLIIGVVMSFVSLSVNPTSDADRLNTAARRLDALLGTAADDAVLYGREIGLDITRGGYRFLRLGDDGWRVIGGHDTPLRPRDLPEHIGLALTDRATNAPRLVGDDAEKEDVLRPEAVFLSSGEAIPVELELYADNVSHRFRLSIDASGKRSLERIGVRS